MGLRRVAMKYQDCGMAAQAVGTWAPGPADSAARLAEANINPATGLATDYLNHFNEAIMLLEMLSSCPDCAEDFLAWRPLSYREHFAASGFKDRALAIAAYEAANPALRDCLDALAGTMTAVLEATRAALAAELPAPAARDLAERAVAGLKPLVARAGAVINGDADAGRRETPQAVVDLLMQR
jgi:hypothetical protein